MILLVLGFAALGILMFGVVLGVWLSHDAMDDWREFQRAYTELFDQDRM